MTKHRKYKKCNKRTQRGGVWPFTESDPTAPTWRSKASNWFQSKTSGENSSWGSLFGSTTPTTTSTTTTPTSTPTSTSTTYTPPTPETVTTSETVTTPPTPETVITGGKRRKKSLKGGKGGLGLTYYATPVSGLNVVEPNEWLLYNNMANLKGGSRKRKCKSRRCKSRRYKTRRCKTRRCKR
jgi:hypothetical protein